MIDRKASECVRQGLRRQAAVVLLGPRQVGKTTLAQTLIKDHDALYLDLEAMSDRAKLIEPALYLSQFEDRLVILDEIHRVPELFQSLRGIIDEGRRKGKGKGRFLLLGSASMDLLKQSGESLAGRVEYVEMDPLTCEEVGEGADILTKLWVRGGFPDSFLAESVADSYAYRTNFIRSYLERDVPQFGPRIPAETLERLWMMLAHGQGSLLNASKLGASLALAGRTVSGYIDLFCDLLMVRRLTPHHANLKKRLVKSPKVYLRDSGLLHALLGIVDFDQLAGHPVLGASWEGFVIENLLSAAPERTMAEFYRTSAGAEVDLLLHLPGRVRPWAVEIKYGLSPKPGRGFHSACDDLQPEQAWVVYGGQDRFPLSDHVEAISLAGLVSKLRNA